MDDQRLKSGQELVDHFFSNILPQDDRVDDETKNVLIDLYKSGQFKADKIEKKLSELRVK